MWETRSVFQGRWEEWGNRSLVFHAFHGPAFPQPLWPRSFSHGSGDTPADAVKQLAFGLLHG
jgi:hypothetical protein